MQPSCDVGASSGELDAVSHVASRSMAFRRPLSGPCAVAVFHPIWRISLLILLAHDRWLKRGGILDPLLDAGCPVVTTDAELLDLARVSRSKIALGASRFVGRRPMARQWGEIWLRAHGSDPVSGAVRLSQYEARGTGRATPRIGEGSARLAGLLIRSPTRGIPPLTFDAPRHPALANLHTPC